MEQLRNFSQVCRQHYEKLVLTAALFIVAGAVWFLYSASVAEREKIRDIPKGFEGRKVKPVQPANLASFNIAIKLVENPPVIEMSRGHLLFNPMPWQSRSGALPIKVTSPELIGPMAMQITGIRPLNLGVAFGYAATSGTGADLIVNGYTIYTTNEVFVSGSKRLLRTFMSINASNHPAPFILREIKGDAKEPTEVLAEMKEGGDRFSFAPGKPYFRVLAHEADLFYKPSNRKYTALRKGTPIDIDGQNYKIVDILPNKVVLLDDSNGKQYSITSVQQ